LQLNVVLTLLLHVGNSETGKRLSKSQKNSTLKWVTHHCKVSSNLPGNII